MDVDEKATRSFFLEKRGKIVVYLFGNLFIFRDFIVWF